MKRTPLQRKTPLRSSSTLKRGGVLARSPMKRKRPRVRAAHLRDDAYLAWLRTLPCACCDAPPPSHAHHSTGAGLALKAPDREAMPLKPEHHHDLHALAGSFKGWTRERLREWQAEQVQRFQALYASRAA